MGGFNLIRRLGLTVAVAAALAVPAERALAGMLRFGPDGAAAKIDLPVGQSRVVQTAVPIETLVIGDPEVAEAVLLSPRSFYLLGRGAGQTNVTVFSTGEWPIGIVDVEVGVDLSDLRLAIAQAAPDAAIEVQTVNGRLRLAGSAPNAPTLARVLEIAGQYGSDSLINAIHVEGPQQVTLEVRIIEASRNAGKDLGISFSAERPGSLRAATRPGLLGGALPFGSFLAQLLSAGLDVDVLIDALEQKGLARSLAEPNLTALSGESASFLAGGEIPIPVNAEDGRVTVQYREFGVRLQFTPVVLAGGMINLRLEPEVSQIDFSTTVETNGISLPGFTTRRASTTVELADGQSFAIAGLLQSTHQRRLSQVPWLGDVPVIGALFRSASYQKQETDLVIIVTPRLARPSSAAIALATPLDRTRPTPERTFLATGRAEVADPIVLGIGRGEGVTGPFGHILTVDR